MFPEEGRVTVYADTADRIEAELERKRKKPNHVYFSPSTDVFQPVDSVLDMAYRIFEALLVRGIGVAFVSKGMIPERHMALLCAHPDLVRAQIGIITMNKALARLIEPNAPEPATRLTQMERLCRAGVQTRLRVAPIVPGLTDEDETLKELFRCASECGAVHASVNAMHLRPAITASLRRHLGCEAFQKIVSHYESAKSLEVCGGKSRQTPLDKTSRLTLFERARHIARGYGIEAHVCGCMNPDLPDERCALDGEWSYRDGNTKQMALFEAEQDGNGNVQ